MRALILILATLLSLAATSIQATAQAADHWVASWAAPQQVPEDRNLLPAADLTDATLRQHVRLSLGGTKLRVTISNVFGIEPLNVGAVRLARPDGIGSGRIIANSAVNVTFGGAVAVTIPPGAEYRSDPVALSLAPLSPLVIDLYLPQAPARQTGHPGSRATSFTAPGNQAGATSLAGAKPVTHWYQIAAVEVLAPAAASTVAVIGDSITDGSGSTTDGNDRWPDVLADRLAADPATRRFGVINLGIGGNRVLADGLGPNLAARFERDVIARAGVRHVIVLEGVNDLGVLTRDAPASAEAHAAIVAQITAAYRQIVTAAHAHGIRAIGATILPYAGSGYYHPGPQSEADRQAINAWIRAPGNFDAVIDFAKLTADRADATRMAAAFDGGDGLHPSAAGYRMMAGAIPLRLFDAKARATAPPPMPVVQAAPKTPTIALTFDDLPVHGPLPKGDSRTAVAARILAALKEENIAGTMGLINGGAAANEPGAEAVFDQWRAGGQMLGNHGWLHKGASAIPVAATEEEISRNEPILAAKMAGQDWKWYRYPFLDEGTPDKRGAIRDWLRGKQYHVASVTMDFGDWSYGEAWARCRDKGDTKGFATLQTGYLAAAADALARARASAKKLTGGDIPYVILLHAGPATADMLPRLIAYYRSQGMGFSTIAEAEAHPFYRDDLTPSPASTAQADFYGANVATGFTPPDFAAICR